MKNIYSESKWEFKPSLVIAATIAVFIGINVWVQQKTTAELQENQNQSLKDIADALAKNLTNSLVIDDYANLEKRIEDVINEKDYIQSIVLSRPNGVDTLRLSRLKPGGVITIEFAGLGRIDRRDDPQEIQNKLVTFSKRVPINAGPANLGSLQIFSWKSNIENRAELIQRTIFLSSTFSLLPAFIAIFYVVLNRNRAKVHMITEQKNKQLIQANILAESASTAKTEFLSRMTHELRTPMNAVLGITHLAIQAEPENSQLNYLKKIEMSGSHLLSIINDILDFSKIESGKLVLYDSSFLLQDVVDEVVNLVAYSIFKKGIEFVVILDPSIPSMLCGDSQRLTQILVNLLSNASKFTEHGTISLHASVFAIDFEKATLQFTIQDSGIGISNDQIQNLFQDFHQAESSTTRRFGGTGLGLSICKHLVELMQGSINVKSTLEEGSCFVVQVPIGVHRSVAAASQSGEITKYKNCLIFAENALVRDVVQGMCTQLKINSQTANDVNELREKLFTSYEQAKGFDLMILDNALFNDAEELIGHQCFQGKNLDSYLSIILMTVPSKESGLDQQVSSLIKASICKPIRLESMKACLRETDLTSVKMDTTSGYLENNARPIWKFNQLRVLLVEDNAINEEICCELLMNVGIQVFSANHGVEALQWLKLNTPRSNSDADPVMPCDVILMDLDMPIMNGWECTQQIRNNPLWLDIPVLAMSAHAMDQEKCRAMAMGFQDYITKPFHPDNLYDRLQYWGKNQTITVGSRSIVSDQSLFISGVNTQEALKRLGGKQKLYLRMLKAFVQTERQSGETLSAHLQNNEWVEARRLVHTVKGVSLTLGITALADISVKLEKQLYEYKCSNDLIESFNQEIDQSVRAIEESLDKF
jgi:signal transduction histidine kinase/CheY-like chemotaxis protein